MSPPLLSPPPLRNRVVIPPSPRLTTLTWLSVRLLVLLLLLPQRTVRPGDVRGGASSITMRRKTHANPNAGASPPCTAAPRSQDQVLSPGGPTAHKAKWRGGGTGAVVVEMRDVPCVPRWRPARLSVMLRSRNRFPQLSWRSEGGGGVLVLMLCCCLLLLYDCGLGRN